MSTLTTTRIGPAPFISVDHEGEGETVVLLHGIGGNKRNWRDAIPALSRDFRVVAWDARGWGESDDYEGPLTFDDMAKDLMRVLEHFEVSRVHLIGLSMGGRIAMHFAALYPERLASLVLCDTTRGILNWSAEQKAAFISSRQAPLLNGLEPCDIALPVARTLVSPSCSSEALDQLVDSLSRLHKESYLKAIEANLNAEPHDQIGRIAVPTLVIVGADDCLTPPGEARMIATSIPGAELLIIPDAGHLVNIEAPDQFNRAVLTFLLKHRMSAAHVQS